GVELVLFDQGAHVERRERDQAHLVLLCPRQQEFEAALLPPGEACEVGEEKDAAGRLGKELGGRLRKQLRARQEARARRCEQPREELGAHAALAAQQQRRGSLGKLRQPLLRVRERGRTAQGRERELRRGRRLGAAQRALDRREQPLQSNGLFQ